MRADVEQIVDAEALGWSESVRGLRRKTLVDVANGPKARLVRIEPGAQVPRHRHPSAEILYVLDGELEMHGACYGPGTCYYKPAAHPYGPLTTRTGVTVLLVFAGADGLEAAG